MLLNIFSLPVVLFVREISTKSANWQNSSSEYIRLTDSRLLFNFNMEVYW